MNKEFEDWIKQQHRNSCYSKLDWIAECTEKGKFDEVYKMMKEAYMVGHEKNPE